MKYFDRFLWTCIALTPLGLILKWLAASYPQLTESLYSQGLYPVIATVLAVFSSWTSFSFTLLMYGFLLLFLFVLPAIYSWKKWNQNKLRGLGYYAFYFFAHAGLINFIFLLVWGLNYSRISIIEQFDLKPVESGEKTRILKKLANATNEIAARYPECTTSTFEIFFAQEPEVRKATTDFLQSHSLPTPENRAKPFSNNSIMLAFGTSGMYSPFTGEANLALPNANNTIPFLVAHELAHFYGFAQEEAASFIAFASLHDHEEELYRYSVYMLIWGYIPKKTRAELGVSDIYEKHRKCRSEFWEKHLSALDGVQDVIYDTYLVSQGVPGGMKNYSYVVERSLSWLKKIGY